MITELIQNEWLNEPWLVVIGGTVLAATSLFLLKSKPKYHRLTLVMIGENRQWRVKHEVCKLCGLTPEDRLTNIVLRMESYVRPPMAVEHMKTQTFSKSATLDSRSIVPEKPKAKIEEAKSLPEPEPQKSAESVVRKLNCRWKSCNSKLPRDVTIN